MNAVAQPFPLRWILISAAALVIGLVGGALLLRHFSRPALLPAQPVIRAPVRLEAGQWLDGQRRVPPRGFDQPTRTAMALSSDGRFMVYSAVKENPTPQDKSQIYFRRMDQMKAVPIAGTEGGSSPFLSPDDRWVGFWADGKLKKVLVDGGVPVTLCDVPGPFGFTWGSDNRIVFVPRNYMGLSRISADGGNPEALTAPDKSKEECSHRLPHALPAAKGILFTITRDPWDMQPRVAVLEAQSGKWRILLDDAADARYIATGHLAFMRQGTLTLVPFDTDRLRITGEPFPAVENVTQALNTGHSYFDTAAGQFDICASGSLVFTPGGILPDREDSLVWVDHRGNAEPITSLKAPFATPRLSPTV